MPVQGVAWKDSYPKWPIICQSDHKTLYLLTPVRKPAAAIPKDSALKFRLVKHAVQSKAVFSHDEHKVFQPRYIFLRTDDIKGELNPKIKLDLNDFFCTLINKYNRHIF